MPRIILIFTLLALTFFHAVFARQVFELKRGDLLFQELASNPITDAVTAATTGYKNYNISHIAIVVDTQSSKEPKVIEAYRNGVEMIPLSVFLTRSVDKDGRPKVMVGRLKPEYQYLTPKAAAEAKAQLGQPYNQQLLLTTPGFYCSQLIAYIFKQANNGEVFFKQQPMNFKNLKTHKYPKAWKDYFKKINKPIPQNRMGTNPAAFSRDPRVDIVYFYGTLSERQS